MLFVVDITLLKPRHNFELVQYNFFFFFSKKCFQVEIILRPPHSIYSKSLNVVGSYVRVRVCSGNNTNGKSGGMTIISYKDIK